MATDTPLTYRNMVIYEIYVRSHGPNGSFADVEADLPRIRSMGVDVIWFMPIHPIGEVARKGTLGSPYANQDYREVNPEFGTRQDFFRLVEHAHTLGLKVMIDVVYNHTAPDSLLVSQHPEFFHQDASGKPITTVPEWSDVIDLKHPHPELTAYLIETLQGWAHFGVDGFRCDVASLLPVDFWRQARTSVAEVKPGVIWLAESVHAAFVSLRRNVGLSGYSDSELYSAFDLTYDYDIWPIWQQAVRGDVPVSRYLEMLRFQDCIYPANFVKMRCVENHDQARIMGIAPSRTQAIAWTAFEAFNKGAFLIYGGQEAAATHTPSLFEREPVEWGSYELQPFLTKLATIKKDPALIEGQFILLGGEPAIQAAWQHPTASLYGVFNVSGATGEIDIELPDGQYTDLLSETSITVKEGRISFPENAVILRYGEARSLKPLFCELLDYQFLSR
jgi:glycosidase